MLNLFFPPAAKPNPVELVTAIALNSTTAQLNVTATEWMILGFIITYSTNGVRKQNLTVSRQASAVRPLETVLGAVCAFVRASTFCAFVSGVLFRMLFVFLN